MNNSQIIEKGICQVKRFGVGRYFIGVWLGMGEGIGIDCGAYKRERAAFLGVALS